MGGFFDHLRMVLGWWNSAPVSIFPPAGRFAACFVFVGGATAVDTFLPGVRAAKVHVPGATRMEVVP